MYRRACVILLCPQLHMTNQATFRTSHEAKKGIGRYGHLTGSHFAMSVINTMAHPERSHTKGLGGQGDWSLICTACSGRRACLLSPNRIEGNPCATPPFRSERAEIGCSFRPDEASSLAANSESGLAELCPQTSKSCVGASKVINSIAIGYSSHSRETLDPALAYREEAPIFWVVLIVPMYGNHKICLNRRNSSQVLASDGRPTY
jgi:hypothetical protein